MLSPSHFPSRRDRFGPRSGRLLRAVLAMGALTIAAGGLPGWAQPAPTATAGAEGKAATEEAPDLPTKHASDDTKVTAPADATAPDAPATEQPTPQPDALLAPEASPPEMSIGLSDMLGPFIKSMLMLAVVVGLAYLTLHKGLGKLMVRAQAGKRIKVIERVSLDQRRSLYLVDIDGKELVLAGGEGGVVHIASVDGDGVNDLKSTGQSPTKSSSIRTFKDVLQNPRAPQPDARDDEQAS